MALHVPLGGAEVAEVPLARRNLLDNRPRLLRSASGIGFAVFLMLMQLGFRAAFINSTIEIIKNFDADIVLTSVVKYQFGKKASFSRRQLYEARGVPGVASARPIYGEWNRSIWKNPYTHQSYAVQVLAFDPNQQVFLFPEVRRDSQALLQPDTVMVDSRSRRFIGKARAGLETELAGRKVHIIGSFVLGPDFTTDGTIIMSDRTFEKLFGIGGPTTPSSGETDLSELPDVEFGLIKVTPGADVATVQRALKSALPANVAVLTRQQLVDQESAYQAKYSGVGPIFGVGTVIGFVVGMMISYQVLFNDISDQLPQYATLKAIGYSNRYLMKVVLQQAVFYACVGYVPAFLVASGLLYILGEILLLPMRITLPIMIGSLVLTIGMCVASGLIAVRRVIRADPAEVF
jgi:putative ABC transport system permease protein